MATLTDDNDLVLDKEFDPVATAFNRAATILNEEAALEAGESWIYYTELEDTFAKVFQPVFDQLQAIIGDDNIDATLIVDPTTISDSEGCGLEAQIVIRDRIERKLEMNLHCEATEIRCYSRSERFPEWKMSGGRDFPHTRIEEAVQYLGGWVGTAVESKQGQEAVFAKATVKPLEF